MAEFNYPSEGDLRLFVRMVQRGNYTIGRYLPAISDDWFRSVADCVNYVAETSHYEPCSFHEACSRILYKVAKKHELTDANKRSAVIAVYLFCILNDYRIIDPQTLKHQAKRIASTKGRNNEELLRTRVAECLQEIIVRRDQ